MADDRTRSPMKTLSDIANVCTRVRVYVNVSTVEGRLSGKQFKAISVQMAKDFEEIERILLSVR